MLTGTTEFSFFAMGNPYFAESMQDGSLFTDAEKLAEFTFYTK
ncbi:hypothetical protein [Halalkalibacter sp. APA_J-10(15)]|nr:hypothetical protein [Halalkalibacter sp. APA_J-10(15)]